MFRMNGIHRQDFVVVFFCLNSKKKKNVKTFKNILMSIQLIMNWTYNNEGTIFVLNSNTDIWTSDFGDVSRKIQCDCELQGK